MPKFKLTLETKGRIFYDYNVEAESLEDAIKKLNNGEVEFKGKPRIEEYDLDPEDVTITDNDSQRIFDGNGDEVDEGPLGYDPDLDK